MSFVPGQTVKIVGVRNVPELNGQMATVQEFDSSSFRYTVLVNDRKIKLKPANLATTSGSTGQAYSQAQSEAQQYLNSYGPLLQKIQDSLPAGVSLTTAFAIALCAICVVFYFFGLVRTLMVCVYISFHAKENLLWLPVY